MTDNSRNTDDRIPEYWPVELDTWRTIRMTLDQEPANALFGAMADYFAFRTEPTMGDPYAEDDEEYGLDIAGRIMFEYFRGKLDRDREAVLVGTFDPDSDAFYYALGGGRNGTRN